MTYHLQYHQCQLGISITNIIIDTNIFIFVNTYGEDTNITESGAMTSLQLELLVIHKAAQCSFARALQMAYVSGHKGHTKDPFAYLCTLQIQLEVLVLRSQELQF